MADLISFKGTDIEFSGKLFTGDAAKTLKDNLAVHVGELAETGQRMVVTTIRSGVGKGPRAQKPGRRSTGFTASSIEVHQDPPNSLYAKVRVKPELIRPGAKGTGAYPAKRIPYIVMAVLETGRTGGKKVNLVRSTTRGLRLRTKWQHGERTRTPLFAFRRAAKEMRRLAPQIRESVLLRDLD